ncbi:pitrilysin family protein [Comamonas sp. Y6]|uniref:Pitrilysin family protein n=2 Tax=Comamonas resistens TaxID=3046670 RepID=A0ABY8SNH9_9BURK|nr:pitrilysin family protein [Comamonas resistens]MDL5038491.1 pitrilysin family protein [Comamonas resistens]WHS64642.1 pitrilysin family protein [Comamonas resistens]
MKHVRALPVLGLMACLSAGAALAAPGASSQPVPAQAAEAAPAVQQFTLKNGMQLIVQPDRRAPTAVHMVWVRVGSMDEINGVTGVAHALEHMMFKGSKTVKPGDFSRRVAALGGQENAFTWRDYTGYYQQIPSSRLEDVMKLESDRFANNQWPDAEFKKEIEVIKEERRMRTDDQPRAVLMEQLTAATFMASPYHHPVVGWMSDLDSMKPADVRDFHKRWYVPANAAVVVVGDVSVAQVRAWAEKYYGSIPARAVPERKPQIEPKQIGVRRIEVKQPAEQAFIAMAYRVPTLNHVEKLQADDKDALALLVLSAVLDGYDGARLERALVQGEGQANGRVADSAGSSASIMGRGPSLFMLTGVPAKGRTAADVEAALRAQIQKIAQEGVQTDELERVKTQWMASNVYERDSVMGQAQNLGNYWIQGMPLDAEDKLLAELKKISSDDVKAVAAKYFGDDQLTVGTLVPQPLPEGSKARPMSGKADTGGSVH